MSLRSAITALGIASALLPVVAGAQAPAPYDATPQLVAAAVKEGTSLRESALSLGYVTAEQFDQWVRPGDMVGRKP